MKHANLMNPCRKLCFVMALAAGMTIIPLPAKADQAAQATQQSNVVRGQVKDKSGEPIIGATVKVKGTNTGVITDFDGNFELRNVPSGGVLVITYVGYKAKEESYAAGQTVNVVIEEDAETLNEVVVVGFATQKKVNLTGSVGLATSKDLEARPVANAAAALQGVIPGLNIGTSNYGGDLNASKSINIRGTGTIGDGSKADPLILIDGMEGDINTINPQDIESISVLKDAAASSIYGSRAPFGVVLVTTKSGKSGRAQINYNTNLRWNTPVFMPDMMTGYQYATFFDQAEFNGNGKHLYSDDERQKILDYMTGKSDVFVEQGGGGKWNYDHTYDSVDWLDEYYKSTSFSQEHNASVSGGSDKFTYYASGNFLGQGGFMRYGTDRSERYTLTGKISAQVTKALKVDYSTRWVRKNYSRPTTMTDSFYNNIMRRARPVRAIKDPNGYYMSDINYIEALQNGGRYRIENDGLSQQLRLTLTPLKGWNIYGELNIKTDNNWTHEASNITYAHYANNPEQTYIPGTTSPTHDNVYEYSYKSTYLNPTIYTDYSLTLADKHNLKAMLGFQSEKMDYKSLNANRNDMITEDLPVLNLTTSTTTYKMNGEYQSWRNAGFFGRLNYDYDGKYLAEFNLRYDGSSRFRRDSRWVWTPSFSLGWNMARENFWKPLESTINTLKLRFSYGELANQNTNSWYPTYQTLAVKSVDGKWLQDGARPTTAWAPGLISSTLTWEKIVNTNIGVDFGMLRNRLTGSFDYFWRKTKNMVGPGVELPATLGTGVPKTNNCDLTTYGWELSVQWRDQIGDFRYGVKLNISDSQTRIDKYPNPTNSLSRYREGEVTGNIYGYTTIGIAKTKEEMDAHLASLPNGGQTALGSNWNAGDIMYADLNNDGKVNGGANTLEDMGDLKKIGNSTPRFRTGINLDASWKGIDFSMFWQGVLKRDWDPGENNMLFWGVTGSGQWWSTSLAHHLDYFRAADTPEDRLGANVDAYYPRPLFNNKNHKTQTRYLQSAAYMRLKNLQIGYTLPKVWVNAIGLQNVRVYVSGENLLTITSLEKVIDPESAGIGWQGGMTYPLSKTYSVGLSVNF
ncbi:MAG: TonB-dependent receptor [Prevotella sp.]|nr:TonB-dependent receptor [Prevotella sp.]